MTLQGLPDKWIEGLDAAAPAGDAAQRVVDDRLASVSSIMRKVVKTRAKRDEAVHQLRVATRRAEAALLAFKPWLKREKRRIARKALRRLRTAAGEVRMCDVHRELLGEALREERGGDRPEIEAALIMLDSDRDSAKFDLFAAARRIASKDGLPSKGTRWVRREDESPPVPTPSAADLSASTTDAPAAAASSPNLVDLQTGGQIALRDLAEDFCAASEADLTSRENLHQLRLRGKRLRYALEIFGSTADDRDSLAVLGASMVDLQEQLGKVNDCHEVAERLARYSAKVAVMVDAAAAATGAEHSALSSALAPKLERVADHFESRCARLAAEFLQWWAADESAAVRGQIERLAGRTSSAAVEENAPPLDVVVVHRNGEVPNEPAAILVAVDSSEGED